MNDRFNILLSKWKEIAIRYDLEFTSGVLEIVDFVLLDVDFDIDDVRFFVDECNRRGIRGSISAESRQWMPGVV